MKHEKPDVVYIIRQGEENEELRYSLRSLKNLPHGKVFIVGYKPSWVTNVEYIHTDQPEAQLYKYQNSGNNIAVACESPDISENFLLMNDDFFIMKKIGHIPPYLYIGTVEQAIKAFSKINPNSAYVQGMKSTQKMLRRLGVTRMKSYESHTPFLINKEKWLALREIRFNRFREIPFMQMRTFYGNLYKIGGFQIKTKLKVFNDVKIVSKNAKFSKKWNYLSTSEGSFAKHKVGKYIRARFPQKSRYEI
jgi:hypothetical protein